MRAALRRNRSVAKFREACHIWGVGVEGRIVALVWHRKHIEGRTGKGILPVILPE